MKGTMEEDGVNAGKCIRYILRYICEMGKPFFVSMSFFKCGLKYT